MNLLQRFLQKTLVEWARIPGRLLTSLSVMFIPLALLVLSAISLFFWSSDPAAKPQTQLPLRVLSDMKLNLSPQSAKRLLDRQPLKIEHETNLSEHPVWFKVSRPAHSEKQTLIEFPSRHILDLSCWDEGNLKLVGQLIEGVPSGALMSVKAGVALRLSESFGNEFICFAKFQGPAKLTAYLWSEDSLDQSSDEFQRKTGLLDGCMLVVALFALISAVFNQDKLFVIFATWVFLSLRISSTAFGWDTQWFHHDIPTNWLSPIRSLTRAMWAILTVSLFQNLFKNELTKISSISLIKITEWLCVLLLISALTLPRSDFLLALWVIGTAALVLMMICLVEMVYRFRSSVSLLYAASMTVILLSNLSEIMAVSLGFRLLIDVLNAITSAMAASVLAALAIAVQLRNNHLKRSEEKSQLQHAYDTSSIGLFTMDMDGVFHNANPAAQAMLELEISDEKPCRWDDFFSSESWPLVHDLLSTENECELEVEGYPKTDSSKLKRYFLTAKCFHERIEATLQDITERSFQMDELRFFSTHDPVTGALSRHGFEIEYSRFQDKSKNQATSCVVAYINLDRIGLINELYGYDIADEVVKQVVESLSKNLTIDMRLARISNEAIVILMLNTDTESAQRHATYLLETIDSSGYQVGVKTFSLKGFIGLVQVKKQKTANEVLTQSGYACREAKFSSKNRVICFSALQSMAVFSSSATTMEERFKNGTFMDGMYLQMQPILSLKNPLSSLNFEVFLRMRDETGKSIPINQVLSEGEQSGRMAMIDFWVVSNTLDWIEEHAEQLSHTQLICVNLSGSTLGDERLTEKLLEIFRVHSRAARLLCIEITESIALRDTDKSRRFIAQVHAFGVRVSLDDFGTGYTSFAYLRSLSADFLKIDGSFVTSLCQHPANVTVVEGIVNLARHLGMQTIAEWAEDAGTVKALADLGVDYAQGYVIACPMDAGSMLAHDASAEFVADPLLKEWIANWDKSITDLGSREDASLG